MRFGAVAALIGIDVSVDAHIRVPAHMLRDPLRPAFFAGADRDVPVTVLWIERVKIRGEILLEQFLMLQIIVKHLLCKV